MTQSLSTLYHRIEKAEPNFSFDIVPSRDSLPSLLVRTNQKQIYFHSRFAPQKEAEKIVKALSPEASLIIIAGFGLGYHISEALKRAPKAKIFVLEKDPFFLKLALKENPNCKRIIENKAVSIFFDSEELLNNLGQVSTKKINYFFFRPALECFPKFYNHFKNLLIPSLQKKNINMATLSRFQKLWAKNIVKNLPLYLYDEGVKKLFAMYKNVPVLLIGAGPSFEESLPFIREAKDKSLIIAVDSIANRLLKENIEPDFIVSVDPQIINYYFFFLFRNQNFSSSLVYEPSVNFLIPRNFKNRRFVFDSIFPIMKWIAELNGEKKNLDMGGSVSTTAFDLAVKIGGNPIFLIGQDLAFDHNKTHARGSFAEYHLLKGNRKMCPLETLSFRYSNSNFLTEIKSNSGQTVYTDKRLLLFYWWFDKKIRTLHNVRVFNLAYKGAAIEGVPYLQFSEASKMFKKFSLINKIKLVHETETPNLTKLQHECQIIQKSLSLLIVLVEEALAISKKLYDKVKKKSRENFSPFLRRLDEIDKEIEKSKQENHFIGITMQKTIFSILEDYDDFLSEEEKKDSNLGIARKSILMYEALKESIQYNSNLFKEIASVLQSMQYE